MDKPKQERRTVKDRLLGALMDLAGEKDWSKVTVTELIAGAGVARASFYRNFSSVEEIVEYGVEQMARRYHEGRPSAEEDFRDRELMRYKFRFYGEHAGLVLAFHRARAASGLLNVITDCVIDARGDMPVNSISRYELYYYAGAFYNMLLCWLEGGTRETPEAMAEEFLRLAGG